MCAAVLPIADQNRLLMLSPTCTANELGGKHDHFMRVISPTRVYASRSARYQYGALGLRKVALILDQRNKAYTESWSRDFQDTFVQLGGLVQTVRAFESGDDAGLSDIVAAVLAAKPDGVVLVANSVDAALLTQQLRRRVPDLRISASEWASTERYIELAGKSAEGVLMAQFFDRSANAPAYVEFRNRYRDRFGEEPGFGGVAAYDAAMLGFEAIRRHPDRPPRDAILAIRHFEGLQGAIEFDDAGEAHRMVFMTLVRDGRFVVVPFETKQP
jgi:branched-chain amino acid transport system substrate-binding protein